MPRSPISSIQVATGTVIHHAGHGTPPRSVNTEMVSRIGTTYAYRASATTPAAARSFSRNGGSE